MLDLDVLLDPTPWAADALCVEYPEVEFFPERGQDSRPAKAVCARCLVRFECRDYAIAEGIKFGIWGGTSERERRSMRSPRRTVAA
jgi:WhiB family redox-sensing transcriptional regulator